MDSAGHELSFLEFLRLRGFDGLAAAIEDAAYQDTGPRPTRSRFTITPMPAAGSASDDDDDGYIATTPAGVGSARAG